jgi:hypothetical protein
VVCAESSGARHKPSTVEETKIREVNIRYRYTSDGGLRRRVSPLALRIERGKKWKRKRNLFGKCD